MILTLDTIDDRREIIHLLGKLPPRTRVSFLSQACETIKKANCPKPVYQRSEIEHAYRNDAADNRLTNAVYFDLLTLGFQWGLDLKAIALNLEQIVRRLQRNGSANDCTFEFSHARTSGNSN